MCSKSIVDPPADFTASDEPVGEEASLRHFIAALEKLPDIEEDLASALNYLADLLAARGRCDAEVLSLYQRALKLFVAAGGETQSDVANLLNNLASVHYERGEYRDSERLSTRAIKIMETLFTQTELVKETNSDRLDACRRMQRAALSRQANARRAQGDYAGAESTLLCALRFGAGR